MRNGLERVRTVFRAESTETLDGLEQRLLALEDAAALLQKALQPPAAAAA